MNDWLTDSNGNRCSIEYFGSCEAAQTALDSLADCRNCTNCSGCSGCSGCSHCSDCSGCSRCSGCSDCSDCSGCSRCSGCSHVADLYGRKNLQGDPEAKTGVGHPPIPIIPNIDAAVLAACSGPRALDMRNWHSCNTTHCRGGWVVHLAGEAGYALERFHNTALAAQLIYRESGSPINPGRFYDSNEAAMADMRKRAEAAACCNDFDCGCRDRAEAATELAREAVIEAVIDDVSEIDDVVTGLSDDDYASLNRAYQLILRNDDIAGGTIIRRVLNAAIDGRLV